MAIASIPSVAGGGVEPKYQKFTSSGTFTLPSGYGAGKPLLVNVQVFGAGGAGGGGRYNVNTNLNSQSFYYGNYFGSGGIITFNSVAANVGTAAVSLTAGGAAGGSGGLASTQMYLTSNLTITVGAAGTRANSITYTMSNLGNTDAPWNSGGQTNTHQANQNVGTSTGGNGGTSTAGSVSAAGGNAGSTTLGAPYFAFTSGNALTAQGQNHSFSTGAAATNSIGINSNTVGTGGSPAGTAGHATPLLGTMAGGSTNTTAIFGSYGVGGKSDDGATSTGVEGTGGGYNSIGTTGAVILTWWE